MSTGETSKAGENVAASETANVVPASVWADGVEASPPLTASMFRTREDDTRLRGASASTAENENCGVRVTLPGVVGLLNLRADPARTNLAEALSGATALSLPGRVASAMADRYCLRWLSPDEWLLSCPPAESLDVEKRLREVLDGPFSISNVSGGYAVLEIAGPAARAVLAKSTPLDVDPRAFAVGRVAGTVFAKTTVTLRRVADERYELICRRSFADYLARWIAHAAAEHGLSVSDPPA